MLMSIIGFLAAFTSTIALFPQIIKIHKTKSADDLSNAMLLNFIITSILWIIYGFMSSSMPVLVCNLICFLSSLWILVLKWKYV